MEGRDDRKKEILALAIGSAALAAGVCWYVYRKRKNRRLGMLPIYTDLNDFGTLTFDEYVASLPQDGEPLINQRLAETKERVLKQISAGDTKSQQFFVECSRVVRAIMHDDNKDASEWQTLVSGLVSSYDGPSQECAAGLCESLFPSLLFRTPQDLESAWPLYRMYALACKKTMRFELGLLTLQQGIRFLQPLSFTLGVAHLYVAELLNTYAQRLETNQDNPRFLEICILAIDHCKKARRCFDHNKAMLAKDPFFHRPENLMLSVYYTWGRLDESETILLNFLDALSRNDVVGPLEYAKFYEDYAVLVLERCLTEERFVKVRWAYEKAFAIYATVPGTDGVLCETYRRAELASHILERDVHNKEARQWVEEARKFSEQHRIHPVMSANSLLYVISAQVEIAPVENANEMSSVEARVKIRVRLMRYLETKKPRVPPGSRLRADLFEWEDRSRHIATIYDRIMDESIVCNPDREKRVITILGSHLRLNKASYVCVISVHGKTLEQHLPCFVDCNNTLWAQAQKEMESVQLPRCYGK